MSIKEAIIKQLIRKEFLVDPTSIERIKMGVMNFNFRFNLSFNEYIIRVSPFERKGNSGFEYTIMKELFERNCKVPEPLVSSEAFGYSYLIYKPLKGEPLSILAPSEESINDLSASIVSNINCLSSFKKDIWEN